MPEDFSAEVPRYDGVRVRVGRLSVALNWRSFGFNAATSEDPDSGFLRRSRRSTGRPRQTT